MNLILPKEGIRTAYQEGEDAVLTLFNQLEKEVISLAETLKDQLKAADVIPFDESGGAGNGKTTLASWCFDR